MKMKTVNIKGKEYVEVNERVKYFQSNYEGWSIQTELLSNENGVCVFKAEIRDSDGLIKATGHAYENEGSTYINKTSYIENCETSAVGRALGFLGIGIDTSIASSDEVKNAINNQTNGGSAGRPSEKQVVWLRKYYIQKKGMSGKVADIKVRTFKTSKAISEEISKLVKEDKASE